MSSRNRPEVSHPQNRRRVLALIGCALLAGPALTACQPLYSNTQSGARLRDVMAGLEITEIPGRVGQRVRNELIFTSTGGGRSADALYRLDISVRESVTDTLVARSGSIQSQLYNLDAQFKLIRIADNQMMLEGRSVGRATFDRFRPIFSNVRARIDAENRAARVVADGIRTRIAAFLSSTA
ncbi:MAG: hypothetical protein ACE5FM_06880 [Methyloligellaceae bacterium]